MFNDPTFGMMQFKVAPGDRLFMFTDGLVESVKNKITWSQGADSLLPLFKKVPRLPNQRDAPIDWYTRSSTALTFRKMIFYC